MLYRWALEPVIRDAIEISHGEHKEHGEKNKKSLYKNIPSVSFVFSVVLFCAARQCLRFD